MCVYKNTDNDPLLFFSRAADTTGMDTGITSKIPKILTGLWYEEDVFSILCSLLIYSVKDSQSSTVCSTMHAQTMQFSNHFLKMFIAENILWTSANRCCIFQMWLFLELRRPNNTEYLMNYWFKGLICIIIFNSFPNARGIICVCV